jgi:hypothetical protein
MKSFVAARRESRRFMHAKMTTLSAPLRRRKPTFGQLTGQCATVTDLAAQCLICFDTVSGDVSQPSCSAARLMRRTDIFCVTCYGYYPAGR